MDEEFYIPTSQVCTQRELKATKSLFEKKETITGVPVKEVITFPDHEKLSQSELSNKIYL